VNVTLIVHVIPAGTDAPHVFVSAKSPELVIEAIFRTRLPLFFSMIVLAGELAVVTSWLPKSKLVGVRSATGAFAVPVPVSVANCGVGSVSVKTSLADSADATEGVKATLTVHEAPAARLAPHVPPGTIAKSVPAAGGVIATTATLVIASAVELLFVKVTVCDAVVAPTSCVPKSTFAGDTTTDNNKGNFATNASEAPFSVD
jgi:hypothetical protein